MRRLIVTNKDETYTAENNSSDYSESNNIFDTPVIDNTISDSTQTDYYSISNQKNSVSININIRNEENKNINKRINE